ncbi:hypothetical protein [Pelagibacterium sp.]
MNRADRKTAQTTKQIEGRFSKMGTALVGQFGALAGRLIGPLAGGAAIAGVRNLTRNIAMLGDEAQRAGLSFQAFQELKYVAEVNRIAVDGLVDGIKELNLRADEFIVTGGGSAAEAFQRLGYDAETLALKLQDPSVLFAEIIGKLGELDQAAQIRISDEVFGGSAGERFVQLIDDGREGIEDTIREAHELGAVLDDEVIKAADELDRKFNAVATTVGSALKTAIVEAATALDSFIHSFNNFFATAGGGTVGAGANQPLSEQLTPDQRNAMRLRLALGNRPGENLYEGFTFGPDGAIDIAPPPPPGAPPTRPGGGSSSSGGRNHFAEAIADYRKRIDLMAQELTLRQQLGAASDDHGHGLQELARQSA